jgi:uncharacterized protein (AIM24 family)
MDKLVGAGKRILNGESLFITVSTHTASQNLDFEQAGLPTANHLLVNL